MSQSRRVRVAACQYPIEQVGSLVNLERKLDRWLADARVKGAQLAILPEYAALELLSLPEIDASMSAWAQFTALQPVLLRYDALCAELAARHGLYVLAGSAPRAVTSAPGQRTKFENQALFFAPSGARQLVGKVQPTPFEREWGLSAAQGSALVATQLGTFGVAICYDSEFPLIARELAAAGAEVILVPSCTDTVAGYHRVRVGCQARALENQCYVVQAVTVGSAAWCAAVDTNHGAAGIYCPPDLGFPEDGVVAAGQLDQPSWVFAELDLGQIQRVRREGHVRTFRDWTEPGHLGASVRAVTLS